MADNPAFDFVCEAIERLTSLDRLEARGTIRLALKQSGLEARSVTHAQMSVMAEKVLPGELELRGIEDADHVCVQLVEGLRHVEAAPAGDSPEAIFERLGG